MTTLAQAQKKYKLYADKKRQDTPTLKVGQRVWLLRRHIHTNWPKSKLDHKRLGPFVISKVVSSVAFELNLPPSMKIHNVFHVSLLEPAVENTFPTRHVPPPPPITLSDDQVEYEVEEILDSRIFKKHGQYLVHWKGYPIEERSWEPFENLSNCPELLRNFHQQYPTKPGPWLDQHPESAA